jgi:hypothetical protein
MEAIRSSETSVHTRSTQRHIQEDGILHLLPEDGGDTFLRNVGSPTQRHILEDDILHPLPEDGGDTFLRNVGSHKIYTAPHPRRHSS